MPKSHSMKWTVRWWFLQEIELESDLVLLNHHMRPSECKQISTVTNFLNHSRQDIKPHTLTLMESDFHVMMLWLLIPSNAMILMYSAHTLMTPSSSLSKVQAKSSISNNHVEISWEILASTSTKQKNSFKMTQLLSNHNTQQDRLTKLVQLHTKMPTVILSQVTLISCSHTQLDGSDIHAMINVTQVTASHTRNQVVNSNAHLNNAISSHWRLQMIRECCKLR